MFNTVWLLDWLRPVDSYTILGSDTWRS